jgi:hypothetical protein
MFILRVLQQNETKRRRIMAKTKKRRKAKRYDAEKKKELLKQYEQLRKSGKGAEDAAKEVGVPYITLHSWQKKKGKKPSKKAPQRRAAAKAPKQKKGKTSMVVVLVLKDTKVLSAAGVSDLVAALK